MPRLAPRPRGVRIRYAPTAEPAYNACCTHWTWLAGLGESEQPKDLERDASSVAQPVTGAGARYGVFFGWLDQVSVDERPQMVCDLGDVAAQGDGESICGKRRVSQRDDDADAGWLGEDAQRPGRAHGGEFSELTVGVGAERS